MTTITIDNGNGKTTEYDVDFTKILKDVSVDGRPDQFQRVEKRFTSGKYNRAFGMAKATIGNEMSEKQFAEKYSN